MSIDIRVVWTFLCVATYAGIGSAAHPDSILLAMIWPIELVADGIRLALLVLRYVIAAAIVIPVSYGATLFAVAAINKQSERR